MVLRKEMQEEKEVARKEGVHEEEAVAGGVDVAEQV